MGRIAYFDIRNYGILSKFGIRNSKFILIILLVFATFNPL